jgi:hypothetical protein
MLKVVPQIAVFLFVLILGRVAVSRWRLQDYVGLWAAVEYFWLATAAVSIFVIAHEVERMDAAAEVEAKEQTVRVAHQEARMMALGGDMVFEGNQAANLGNGDRAASWYRYLVESLELGYENSRWSTFLAQNAELEFGPPRAGQSRVPQGPTKGWLRLDAARENPGVLAHAKQVLEKLRRLHDAREAWHSARSAQVSLSASSTYRNFREVVSWVIVFALALRIAKVHADRLRAQSGVAVARPAGGCA